MGGGGVLGEMGGAGVLHLRGVDDVLSVVGQLDVGRGAGPLAVVSGVAAVRGDGDGEGSGNVSVSGVAERGAVVRVRVRGQVCGLQVRYLRGVHDAAVVRQRSGAVFDETCGGRTRLDK